MTSEEVGVLSFSSVVGDRFLAVPAGLLLFLKKGTVGVVLDELPASAIVERAQDRWMTNSQTKDRLGRLSYRLCLVIHNMNLESSRIVNSIWIS
jgi:hypothetical protein